jgi:hypothetical protein
MSRRHHGQKRGTRWLLAATILAASAPAFAWNTNTSFCFPKTGSPTIDGALSDAAWGAAARYVNNQGVLVPDSVMLGASDANNLYLSFEVNHDATWSASDAAVLAFEAPGGARRALVLLLGQAGGAALVPNGFRFDVPTNAWVGETPPAGTLASATHTSANGGSWTVELRVPLAGYGLPALGNFGFYANALPTDPDFATDHPWPPGTALIGAVFNPTTLSGLPNPAVWGQGKTANSATACGGVSIASADIYATHNTSTTPSYTIATNKTNTFHALVRNNSTDIGGNFVAADNIVARFKLAQWGISGNWIDTPFTGHPGSPNPTAAATIPANGFLDRTMQWTLSPTEVTQYNTPATRHQCIRVELETSGPTTAVITNRMAQVNMDFGLASRYVAEPRIDPRGWARPPAGQALQKLVLRTSQRIDTLDRDFVLDWLKRRTRTVDTAPLQKGNELGSWDQLKTLRNFPVSDGQELDAFVELLKDATRQTSQLSYFVHGCRRTGQFVEINQRKLELCENVGAFGEVVRHVGTGTASWDVALSGPGLERRGERYEIALPPDQPVMLSNVINATDQPVEPPCRKACGCVKPSSAAATGGSLALIGIAVYWPLRRRRNKQ